MTNSIRDITEQSGCIFIIGSNTTEQHPVIGIKIRRAARRRGAKLIVADPRRIDIATYADIHLRHTPGTDLALLNGLMHIIIREGWQDQKFVDERTEGFEALKEVVAKYTPEVVAEITGVPAEQLEQAARMMAENRPGSLLYAMGITQHTVGVANVTACANLQMLLGNMGVPGGGVNPLRGQNNVQGACDMGGLPNYYPGYQVVTDAAAQAKFEQAWGVPLSNRIGLTVTEMLKGLDAGQRARALRHRREPDDQRPRPEPRARGDDQVRVLRAAGDLLQRDRPVRRCDLPGRQLRGEGRHLHQHRAAHPARPQGRAAARRGDGG